MRKPSNFPPGTPNVQFDGFNLMSYLLRLAKVSAGSVSMSELLLDLTTISSMYSSPFRGIGILQTKWHGDIAKTPEWGDEGRFYFIGSIQMDLMIPGIRIQKRQMLTPRSLVNNLINAE